MEICHYRKIPLIIIGSSSCGSQLIELQGKWIIWFLRDSYIDLNGVKV